MINKEQVLSLTQGGLNVFTHYLGFEINLHRNFRNPFYEDKHASCHIYFDKKSSSYKFYDYGDTSYSGDCFWFVATLLHCTTLTLKEISPGCYKPLYKTCICISSVGMTKILQRDTQYQLQLTREATSHPLLYLKNDPTNLRYNLSMKDY